MRWCTAVALFFRVGVLDALMPLRTPASAVTPPRRWASQASPDHAPADAAAVAIAVDAATLFDTHCHAVDGALDDILSPVALVSTCEAEWPTVLRHAPPVDGEQLLGRRAAAVGFGIHPWWAHGAAPGWRDRLRAALTAAPDAVVGERSGSPSALATVTLGAVDHFLHATSSLGEIGLDRLHADVRGRTASAGNASRPLTMLRASTEFDFGADATAFDFAAQARVFDEQLSLAAEVIDAGVPNASKDCRPSRFFPSLSSLPFGDFFWCFKGLLPITVSSRCPLERFRVWLA